MRSDVHLVKVDGNANNNKFYDMHDNGNNTFTVTYGRVGSKGTSRTYPISKWDSVYNEKAGSHGYTDHSNDSVKISEYKPETDSEINEILQHFLDISRQYTAKFTNTNCLNDSSIKKVQELIDKLTNIKSLKCGAENYDIYLKNTNKIDSDDTRKFFNRKVLEEFNDVLSQIFSIIVRPMKKVNENFLMTDVSLDSSNSAIDKIIIREQTLLDNISIQSTVAPTSGTQTIQEAFGFNFTKASTEEIEFIKEKFEKDCKGEHINRHIVNVFKVCNPTRDAEFEEYLQNNDLGANSKANKNIKLYWHGTGPENILSIMSKGLVIRPSNASYSGSAFGDGIYNAPSPLKANSYTSSDMGRGHSTYMLVNAVITGNSFDCTNNYDKIGNIRISDLNGNRLSQLNLNYHSVHAHASSASYIRRDEVIVYNSSQVATRYLIELK